ncbi:MAG: jacalin-like lectin [Planctomycetota bacterium]
MNTRSRLVVALAFGLGVCSSVTHAQHFDTVSALAGATSGAPFDRKVPGSQHIDQVEVFYTGVVRGIRFRSSDVARTTSSIALAGSTGGTQGVFQIAPGDYLESIVVNHDASRTQIYAVTLSTRSGQTTSFGTPSAYGTTTPLALAGHEIVGFVGYASPFIIGLSVYLRPAWESTPGTPWNVVAGSSPPTAVASLTQHISKVQVEYISFPVFYLVRIRFEMRDDQGAVTGWMPWLGKSFYTGAEITRTLAIAPDDALQQVEIGPSESTANHIRFTTRNGSSLKVGSGGFENVYSADTHHELVGWFGQPSTTIGIDAFGVIQRPLAARTWQVGGGCPASSGLVPGFQVDVPRIGGAYGLQVDGAAGVSGAVLLDVQSIDAPLWSCRLFVSPTLNLPITLDASGRFSTSTTLTNQWSWVGLPLYAQAVLLDGSAGAPISASDAYGMLFGGV